jgi:hypothetical protein
MDADLKVAVIVMLGLVAIPIMAILADAAIKIWGCSC